MDELIKELSKIPPGLLTAIAALAGATGAILAALITGLLGKLVVTPFLGARDKQDREVEWRKHALELTKLEVERKLKSGRDFKAFPMRPSILDFLANYRDLQELGTKTPAALYKEITEKRVKPAPVQVASPLTLVDQSVVDENDG